VPRGLFGGSNVEILPADTNTRREGTRDEILPGFGPTTANVTAPEKEECSRDGFVALLTLLGAKSEILLRVVDALTADPANVLHLTKVGLRFRDPRVRWSAKAGKDPCIIDLAEHESGDTIATYFYPAQQKGKLPVVRVRASTGEARWLADDFDGWLSGYLHDARERTPDLASIALQVLGLKASFAKPVVGTLPPPWFFEAHGTRWTLFDVEEAMTAGDITGAERMLVALGRNGYAERVKDRLASVYSTLGWEHHRATVLETW